MADITSRDFQELIKRQKETTDSLQTIIQQNDRGDDAGERLKDALPEIINDTRLAAQRESFDKKEGITETDNLQQETTDEVIKLQKIQTQGIDETKEQKEEQSELQQQIIEANKKGFLTFGERIKFFALGIKESVTKSNEDKKDEKRDRSKLLTSVQNLGKGILGAITSPIETTFKSIGAILKNLLTGGLLLAALFGLQKFINSPMWPKFLEGLEKTIRATIEMTKTFFKYVGDLYAVFQEEGLGGVAKKLFTDANDKFGGWTKGFLITLGVAIAAFGAAIIFAIKTATSMVRGLGGMMGLGGKGGKGGKGAKGVKPGVGGKSKMEMSGKKQSIKPDKPSRMPGLKNVAKGGLRVGATALRAAGPVGFALGSVAISATDAVSAFGNANELFGKEANNFQKILAGGAGAIEGFTFGLIKAEDLIDTPGDKIERYAKQVEKSQLSFEKFEKFQQKRLEAGDITQEQFDKLIEQKRVATVESMKRNNEKIKKVMDENNKILEKTSIKQVEKINELVELMKDNKKLVAEKENQTASFMMAGGNTNITTNPSEQTIVMDTKITDSFHTQVVRQQFG
tara:strand:+ start:4353 stop:6065 length:1713 start_codon:yes stop_codon:yes gene_type:complete